MADEIVTADPLEEAMLTVLNAKAMADVLSNYFAHSCPADALDEATLVSFTCELHDKLGEIQCRLADVQDRESARARAELGSGSEG